MLEFKVIGDLKPNLRIIELIKKFTYKTKKEKFKNIELDYDVLSIKKWNQINVQMNF